MCGRERKRRFAAQAPALVLNSSASVNYGGSSDPIPGIILDDFDAHDHHINLSLPRKLRRSVSPGTIFFDRFSKYYSSTDDFYYENAPCYRNIKALKYFKTDISDPWANSEPLKSASGLISKNDSPGDEILEDCNAKSRSHECCLPSPFCKVDLELSQAFRQLRVSSVTSKETYNLRADGVNKIFDVVLLQENWKLRFYLFSKLWIELRLKIWQMALPKHRALYMKTDPFGSILRTPRSTPATSTVPSHDVSMTCSM